MSPVPRAVRHELETLQHEVVRDREVLLEAMTPRDGSGGGGEECKRVSFLL